MCDLREIHMIIDTGKKLRIISNDLVSSAEEIAELYKTRWQIELFFRWVKQNLKINKFLGTSENAVRIQLTIAMIAYLLVRMAHASQDAVKAPVTSCVSCGRTSCISKRSTISPFHNHNHPTQCQTNYIWCFNEAASIMPT
jgi:Transposase DDE domain